ncbi:MAG: signal peptidase II [Chloroflexota bacterium]
MTLTAQKRNLPALPGDGSRHTFGALLLVAAAVLAADQVSKRVVASTLGDGRVVKLAGGLVQLDFTANTGAAFGIFKSAGILFIAIALAVAACVIVYRGSIARMPVTVRSGIGLILGGALSNALDRVRLGYVIDFVDLRWWPVFNLADSAIVIGAALLTLQSFLSSDERRTE